MTDAAVTADDLEETSVPGLWETARWFMRWLIALCGGPCALVAEPWLSRRERREIDLWLRPVEAIIRRLLVAEAARIAQTLAQVKKGASPQNKAPSPRPPFCRVACPDPEDSAGWAVRFSVFEPAARPRPAIAERFPPRLRNLDTQADVLAPAALASAAIRHRLAGPGAAEAALPELPARRPKPSRTAGNPWPLARRIEAAVRVLADPLSYARRLARRLRKDRARLQHICRPPPQRPPGTRPPYGEEPLRHASERALEALGASGLEATGRNPPPQGGEA